MTQDVSCGSWGGSGENVLDTEACLCVCLSAEVREWHHQEKIEYLVGLWGFLSLIDSASPDVNGSKQGIF